MAYGGILTNSNAKTQDCSNIRYIDKTQQQHQHLCTYLQHPHNFYIDSTSRHRADSPRRIRWMVSPSDVGLDMIICRRRLSSSPLIRALETS